MMTAIDESPTSKRYVTAGIMTFVGTALLAFNDIAPLRAIGGGLLASPGWLPLCLAVVLVYKDAKTPESRTIIGFAFALVALGFLVSVASLPFLPSQIVGESPSSKAAKLLATMTVWVTIFAGAGLLAKVVRGWLVAGLVTAVAIMVLSSILGQFGVGVFEAPGFFHGTTNGQMRIRGTRFEASSLGAGLICCVSVFAFIFRGRKALVFMAAAYVAVQFLTRSRGTWVTIAIILFVICLLLLLGERIARRSFMTLRVVPWAVVIVTVALSFGLSFLVTSEIWVDFGLADRSGMTSEATRSVWAATALASLLSFPLGMGFAGYLAWLPQLLSEAAAQYAGSFHTADFAELLSIVSSSDDTLLSPKTLPGLLIVFFGWAGAAVAVVLCHHAVRGGLNMSLSGFFAAPVAAFAVLLVSFTYASSVFSWDQALVLGWFFAEALRGISTGGQNEVLESATSESERRNSLKYS